MEDLKVDLELQSLEEFYTSVEPVGSYFTCNPPVLGTDVDFLCLRSEWLFWRDTAPKGYHRTFGEAYRSASEISPFCTFRKNKFNLVVTSCRVFYDRFSRASVYCKRVNVLDKGHRIEIHKRFLQGGLG